VQGKSISARSPLSKAVNEALAAAILDPIVDDLVFIGRKGDCAVQHRHRDGNDSDLDLQSDESESDDGSNDGGNDGSDDDESESNAVTITQFKAMLNSRKQELTYTDTSEA
jgi:hypothetical protein